MYARFIVAAFAVAVVARFAHVESSKSADQLAAVVGVATIAVNLHSIPAPII